MKKAWIMGTWMLLMATTLHAVTVVSSCQTLPTANTVYQLNQSISINGATCFSATAANITLLCQGFELTGNQTLDTAGIASNQINTTIDSCTINGFDNGVDYSSGANASTVQHSNLTNNSAAGLLASDIANLQVTNTTLTRNQNGFELESVNNATFDSLTVSLNTQYGLLFNNSQNNQIHNSTISSSTTFDVYSDAASVNTFLNTTFNRSSVGFKDGAASSITIQWYFQVKTQNATGGTIPSAGVNISNASTAGPEFVITTDANGLTPYVIATEYVQNGVQIYGINETRHTPHNVTALVADYYFTGSSVKNSTNTTVNSTQTFTIVLEGNWALVKGSFSGNKTISNNSQWFIAQSNSSPGGNVFAVPQNGNLNLTALYALTRNTSNGIENDDFADADALLGTTGAEDSVTNVFGAGTGTPSQTNTYTVAGYGISNVPVVNSTNSSNFITGLVWDATTQTNYTQSQKPTLILISKVNQNAQGKYGVYDYEIRVPVSLNTYHAGTAIDFYGEIN